MKIDKRTKNYLAVVCMVLLLVAATYLILRPGGVDSETEKILEGLAEDCDGLEGKHRASCMDSYHMAKAVVLLDSSLCENIENGIVERDCIETILRKRALEESKPSLCEESYDVQDCRDTHYGLKSFMEGDESICDSIIDEGIRISCHDRFHTSQSFSSEGDCSRLLSDHLRNECIETKIMREVLKNDDVTLCNKLEDEKMREECRESYYAERIFLGEQG